MTNLLEETVQALVDAHASPSEVLWVGSADGRYRMHWHQFAAIANVDYDSGYGSAKVATDLVIVLAREKGWLARAEYDGAEWWVHRKAPPRPRAFSLPTKVVDPQCYGSTLAEMHTRED